MPKRSTLALSTRTVEGLAAKDRDLVFWDRDLARFVMHDFIPLI